MKYIKAVLIIVLTSLTFTVSAQVKSKTNVKNEASRARIEIVKGQNALVLKTGRKEIPSNWGASYSNNIVIAYDDDTKKILDSLVVAPWGSAIKMKDLDGYVVDVAKANINSKVGLMFTSGSKCVTITKEAFDYVTITKEASDYLK